MVMCVYLAMWGYLRGSDDLFGQDSMAADAACSVVIYDLGSLQTIQRLWGVFIEYAPASVVSILFPFS